MHTHLGPSPSGSVMLEMGAATGALVIHTTGREHLREIEISPGCDPAASRTHAAVRERVLPDRVLHAAVYPGLSAGTYTVWRSADLADGVVAVEAGTVVEYVYEERSSISHR